MAIWGQGDPRWIVEERADAKNVNNWHWTEKNATSWSIDLIKKLLLSLKVENDEYVCSIVDVTKCEGEAHVNNRKAKLIFLYEWHIEADWTGQKKTGNNKSKFRGKAEVMNLSEEYSIEELDVLISCTSTSADGDAIRKFMQTEGVKGIQSKLAEYLRVLKEEYSQNLILPTKNGPNVVQSQDSCKPSGGAVNQSHTAAADTVSRKPKDLSVKKLTLTEEFFCTPDDLYKVLTTKELVQAFTRGDADVEATSDGKYSIFGGNITGVFGLLTPGKTIEMRWRKRDWPEEHYSQLSLELSPFEGGTRLNLTQTGVPGYDLENTTNGWRSNFFAALKQTYGYGGRMF